MLYKAALCVDSEVIREQGKPLNIAVFCPSQTVKVFCFHKIRFQVAISGTALRHLVVSVICFLQLTNSFNKYRPLKLQSLESLMCGIRPQGGVGILGISGSAQKLSIYRVDQPVPVGLLNAK